MSSHRRRGRGGTRGHRARRAVAAASRWVSMTACGVIAAVVWMVAEPVVGSVLEPVTRAAGGAGGVDPAVLTVGLLTAVGVGLAASGRWAGILGVRHPIGYPPLGVAVAVAMATLWLAPGPHHGQGAQAWALLRWTAGGAPGSAWWAAAALTAAVAAVTALGRSRLGGPDGEDGPIRSADEDLFGHGAVARRIARRIAHCRGTPSTTALVGPRGSGKTSIGMMVREELRRTHGTVFVMHSMWPYGSVDAAIRGTIDAVVRELGRHVNTLALGGVSARYVGAVERSGHAGRVLGALAGAGPSPEETLDRIGRVAEAAGLLVVLWIEDLERFAAPGAAGQNTGSGALLPMLHLLDACPRVAVIVADGSLRARVDVDKIARFVETVPEIGVRGVWTQIDAFRQERLGTYDLIDPESTETRDAFGWFRPAQSPEITETILGATEGEQRVDATKAVAILVTTPRVLRSVLRLTREMWDGDGGEPGLAGEIDLDSLLVANVIRVTRPGVFELIVRENAAMRAGLRVSKIGARKAADHQAKIELEELAASEDHPRNTEAVKMLVGFLFPETGWGDAKDRSQGVGASAGYWERYLAGQPPEEHERDQAVLRSIRAWQRGDESDLIDRVTDPARADQVGHFVRCFEPRDLCRLLEEVAAREMDTRAEEWGDDGVPPGVSAVAAMFYKQPPEGKDVRDSVDRVTRDAARANTPMLYVVYGRVIRPVSGWKWHDQQQLDSALEVFMRTVLSATAEELVERMRGGDPVILLLLCKAEYRRVQQQDTPGGTEPLEAFFRAVVDAAGMSRAGLALLLEFLTTVSWVQGNKPEENREEARPSPEPIVELFDEALLAEFFGREGHAAELDGMLGERLRVARTKYAPASKEGGERGEG